MSPVVTFPRSGPEAHILVVDDEEPIRRSLVRILDKAGYQCEAAADAAEARQLLGTGTFDLMLCDVTMPGESGISLLSDAFGIHPDLAVVMVTAIDSPNAVEPAIRQGADGYVVKPFDTNVILINVVGALRRRAERIAEQRRLSQSEPDTETRMAEVADSLSRLATQDLAHSPSREETVLQVALSAERREPDTDYHLLRMSTHSARLATLVGMAPGDVELIRLASQLHDIGKVGIPDAVLLKRNLLTDEERLIMQGHTETGYKMLERFDSPLLQLGATIALSHHERFDGTGYPHRLVGTEIPIEGRIVAIADVFDALRSKRNYKRAYSAAESLEVLRSRRHAHLDPELLDLFINDLEVGPRS
jgi:putative two-component system response regulator